MSRSNHQKILWTPPVNELLVTKTVGDGEINYYKVITYGNDELGHSTCLEHWISPNRFGQEEPEFFKLLIEGYVFKNWIDALNNVLPRAMGYCLDILIKGLEVELIKQVEAQPQPAPRQVQVKFKKIDGWKTITGLAAQNLLEAVAKKYAMPTAELRAVMGDTDEVTFMVGPYEGVRLEPVASVRSRPELDDLRIECRMGSNAEWGLLNREQARSRVDQAADLLRVSTEGVIDLLLAGESLFYMGLPDFLIRIPADDPHIEKKTVVTEVMDSDDRRLGTVVLGETTPIKFMGVDRSDEELFVLLELWSNDTGTWVKQDSEQSEVILENILKELDSYTRSELVTILKSRRPLMYGADFVHKVQAQDPTTINLYEQLEYKEIGYAWKLAGTFKARQLIAQAGNYGKLGTAKIRESLLQGATVVYDQNCEMRLRYLQPEVLN